MVVDVLVVGHQVLVDLRQVAAHQGIQHLPHRQHHPAEQHEGLAQLERAPLHGQLLGGRRGEQVVFQSLDGVVEGLDRLEVAVHDVVEQAVQQVADAVPGEVGAGVPAVDDLADVQPVVLADGDQRPRQDERRELAGGQLAGHQVKPRAVGREEQVRPVAVDLRPLPVDQGVLDRHGMQPELFLEHQQVALVGAAQVEPDHGTRIGEVIADLLDGEALLDELPVLVKPGPRLAVGRRCLADALGGNRLGVATVEGGVPGDGGPQLPANRPVAGVGFGHEIPLGPAADLGSHLETAARAAVGALATKLTFPAEIFADRAAQPARPRASRTVGSSSVPRTRQSSPSARTSSAPRIARKSPLPPSAGSHRGTRRNS